MLLFSRALVSVFVFFVGLVALAPLPAFADTDVLALQNPGFEQASTSWTPSTVGNISPTFSISTTTPHGGSAAASISLPTYTTDSDAKWTFTPVSVSGGQYYTFSDWYRSSTTTSVFLYYSNGTTETVVWIGDAVPTTNWAQFSKDFFVPTGMTSLTIGHALISAGSLDTDDYSLVLASSTPAFGHGLVTLSFDDGWKTFNDYAFPILASTSVKSTAYIITNGNTDAPDVYMATSTLTTLQASGLVEIGAHTRHHLDLVKDYAANPATMLSLYGYTSQTDLLNAEITKARTDLTSQGFTVDTMAYPYGSYDASVEAVAKANGYIGARSVDQGYNLTNTDPYALRQQHITNTTTINDVIGWINTAINTNSWVIMMFHDVWPNKATQCVDRDHPDVVDLDCTDTTLLTQIAEYVKTLPAGMVVTVHEGLLAMQAAQLPDVQAPTITAPTSVVAEATSLASTTVSWSATALDLKDGVVGVVCTPASGSSFAIGTATTTCAAHDASNNIASTSFPITVRDTTGPVITLIGSSTMSLVIGTPFVDPGASSTDLVDGPMAVVASGTVNTNAYGTYHVIYSATDTRGNSASTTRTVIVRDGTAPVITLIGDATTTIAVGTTYIEQGATALDNVDATTTVVVSGDTIPTPATAGTYHIKYNATDSSGNAAAEVVRTVVVSPLTLSTEKSGATDQTSVTIMWTTSHNATSRVLWDTVSHTNSATTLASAPLYGYPTTTVEDATMTTSHVVTIYGLTAGTTYYFRPVSHGSPEAFGNEVAAATATVPPPPEPPAPSNGGGCGGACGGGGPVGGGGNGPTAIIPTLSLLGKVLGTSTIADTSISNATGASACSFTFTRNLQSGSKGADVTELQKRLSTEGVYTGPITGSYASLTASGVKAYQKKYAIDQTSTVGPKTRTKLNEGCTSTNSTTTLPVSSTPSAPTTSVSTTTPSSGTPIAPVKLGDKGEEVKKLQTKLKALGFFHYDISGNFGSLTTEALKAFQAAKGIPQSGILDAVTLAKLNG